MTPEQIAARLAALTATVAELTAELAEAREENRWAYIQAAMDDRQTDAEAEAATLRARLARMEGAIVQAERQLDWCQAAIEIASDLRAARRTDGGSNG